MASHDGPDGGQASGTVTLAFTDIEGSTRLLQDLGDRYPAFFPITTGSSVTRSRSMPGSSAVGR